MHLIHSKFIHLKHTTKIIYSLIQWTFLLIESHILLQWESQGVHREELQMLNILNLLLLKIIYYSLITKHPYSILLVVAWYNKAEKPLQKIREEKTKFKDHNLIVVEKTHRANTANLTKMVYLLTSAKGTEELLTKLKEGSNVGVAKLMAQRVV